MVEVIVIGMVALAIVLIASLLRSKKIISKELYISAVSDMVILIIVSVLIELVTWSLFK